MTFEEELQALLDAANSTVPVVKPGELQPAPVLAVPTLDAAAKVLYDANGSRASCPPWSQLGDVTRSVWRERVVA